MTLKYTLLMGLSCAAMTGCATMESQPLPETFEGRASIIDMPETKSLKLGQVEIDEYFAEQQIKIGRSARLENDVYMISSLIKKGAGVADAGEVFIALPFHGPGYSNTSQFSWCRAGEAGVNAFENFFTGNATPVCVFWSNSVPRVATGGTGSRIFPEGGVYNPNVWINAPEFTELGESDLGPLFLEVKIDSVSRKGKMKVETMFRDPEGDRSALITKYYTPDEDGNYTIRAFDDLIHVKPIDDEDDKQYLLERAGI